MFLQNKYCRFHLFFPSLSLSDVARLQLETIIFFIQFVIFNRTGAMCNLCCALLYILLKNHRIMKKNSNKNSKDYNLYTLKKKNAQDKLDFDLFL